MAGETKTGTLLDEVTVLGRASIRLPKLPSMTLFFVTIVGGTATVVVEISDDEILFIPVASVTQTSAIQFAIPCSVVACNVSAISGATVTVTYRSVVLENMPSETLLIYGASGEVSSPIILPTQTIASAEAITLKKLVQVQIAASAATVYTVPAATQTLIRQMFLVNPTGTDRIATLWQGGSTDPFVILPPTTILAGGFATFAGNISMAAADTLVADSDSATAVTLTVYGYEQPIP